MASVRIQSGRLNRIGALHSVTGVEDAAGTRKPTLSGTPVATLRIAIRSLSGNESVQAEQVTGFLTHEITSRYYAALMPVTSKMAWKIGSRIFNVDSVHNEDERNVKLVWQCVEVKE